MTWLESKLQPFFFTSLRHYPLAICRAAFGLCIFIHYASLYNMAGLLWGPDGLTGERWRAHIEWAVSVARPSTLSSQIPFLFQGPGVWIMYAVLLLSSLCFAAGFWTRTTGVLALALHILFHAQNEFIYWGWAVMIKPFMLYVILGDAGRWYSLDAYIRERKWKPEGDWTGPAWPLRLVQVHLTTLYLVVAWTRLDDPNWLNGSMVYGILTDTIFARIDSDWIAFKGVIRWLCYGSWGLELAAPLLLWWNRTRRYAVFALFGMHLGLEALTMVGQWNFIVLAALTTFLVRPNNR